MGRVCPSPRDGGKVLRAGLRSVPPSDLGILALLGVTRGTSGLAAAFVFPPLTAFSSIQRSRIILPIEFTLLHSASLARGKDRTDSQNSNVCDALDVPANQFSMELELGEHTFSSLRGTPWLLSR